MFSSYSDLDDICYITEHRSYQESAELVQNVIVTINNLSFYQTSDNYVTKCALQISKRECLWKYMLAIDVLHAQCMILDLFGQPKAQLS